MNEIENKSVVLITGSNRGIGLEFVHKYLQKKYFVIATCRDIESANNLNNLFQFYPKELVIEKLDVTNPDNFKQLAYKYSHLKIDILINNAGIFPEHHSEKGISSANYKDIIKAFETNAMGPMLAIQSFKDNLLRSLNPRIINISSQTGALDSAKGNFYSYRMSKVALNMLTRCFAFENKQIITIALRPGWVKTYMGGDNANLSVEDSVNKMIKIIDSLKPIDSGEFFDNEKKPCNW